MIARFKDLCLDANDAHALGAFWGRVLDGKTVDAGDGDVRVDPVRARSSAGSIWVNQVPEPRGAKTRVHLDLRLAEADPAALVASGARVVREPDAEIDWWVLADPEGNLFCAFAPGESAGDGPGAFELVVDTVDPATQAAWWSRIVGGTAHTSDKGYAYLTEAAGFPWKYWVFDPVPERKAVKNRLHWDVDLVDPDPAALIDAGATLLRGPDDRIAWWILADPEGNEFCAFPPRPTE